MDFLNYSSKTSAGFPTVSASIASPKTLYHAAEDVVYVNTGSGWQPMAQPGSNSVYTAYTTLDAATKTSVLASVADVSAAPHTAHKSVAAKVTDIAHGK